MISFFRYGIILTVIEMELVKELYIDQDLPKGWKPYYIFLMMVDNREVGRLTLREGSREERYYDGHVGYSVEAVYRGHGYAFQAVLKLKKIARELGFNELIITCSPDNLASKKTILKLGAKYLETAPIPVKLKKDFEANETEKEIYILELKEENDEICSY